MKFQLCTYLLVNFLVYRSRMVAESRSKNTRTMVLTIKNKVIKYIMIADKNQKRNNYDSFNGIFLCPWARAR